jgi:predicted KAP-like P-loop ATPase
MRATIMKIIPVIDEPIDNATLLGSKDFLEIFSRYLASDTLVSPLVIAITGEWGTGKTSVIKTLMKKLDENGKITIFFDASKYEYSEPAAALFYTIATRLGKTKKNVSSETRKIAKVALDVFVRHYTGISIKEIKEHFETGINNIPTISDQLEKVVNKHDKRIIVFIDNLDRCSLENVLEILDTLKLFLGIKNFIFVIAVDISKIKLAWSYKYGKIDDFAKEGFKYLEKIFQIEKQFRFLHLIRLNNT